MTVEHEGDGSRRAIGALLGDPGAAWIVDRVRRRLESDATGEGLPLLSGVVRLAGPTAEERAAAVRLVGRPRKVGAGLSVDLAVVEQILRRGPWPAGLADAVVTLTGPLADRRGDVARAAEAWRRAEAELEPVVRRFDGLSAWWRDWCAAGGLKRAARAEVARRTGQPGGSREGLADAPMVAADLVRSVRAVLESLPASGEPIAVLARRTLGEAHGLDSSRALGRMTVAVVDAAFGTDEPPDQVAGEASARVAWARAGVVLSNVASTVLCLGVPGATDVSAAGLAGTATGQVLEQTRAARMPVVLTLDQVRSGGVGVLASDMTVHVCENPTVVEVVATRWSAAETAGQRRELVLVCTWGQPSTAVVELLGIIARDGAQVRYHGDFDWAGLRIAEGLRRRVAWVPWRYSAADYRAAVHGDGPSLALTGVPAASPWDEELSAAMLETGHAVEEEAVVDLLSGDLTGLG
ncbi:TIGR02679 family protein [Promicromonospora sp. NPDC023805]|uniref:TIGR02679 family protein n=1 Tax=Promicromonospora sp. NPDC023805 TaxID=3154696 RepID=UPI0033F2E52A